MKRHIGQAVSRGGRIEPKGQVQVERQLVERARKRVDGLLIELAEVRIDAMISGCEAAVLRTQLAMLTDRCPWWCRWFR